MKAHGGVKEWLLSFLTSTPAALLPGKELVVSVGGISRASLDIVGTKMLYPCRESEHDSWTVQSVDKHLKESATMDPTLLLSLHFK
jgi:hypothetical protein